MSDPVLKPPAEAQAYIVELEAKIASNVADLAARDVRIADLEATIEATHKVLDGAGVTWSLGNEATRLPLAKRAEFAAEPDTLTNTEREALTERATKAEAEVARMRGGDRDLAAKDKSLTTAHAALAQVSDLLGSPPPVVPDDAVEAVKMHLARRPQPAPAILTDALDAAGAPKVYHLDDDTERPIPDPERIRLLGERVRGEHAERIREGDRVAVYRDRLAAADLALDDRDAPRLADGAPLSVAARIRSIPR